MILTLKPQATSYYKPTNLSFFQNLNQKTVIAKPIEYGVICIALFFSNK